MQPDQSLISSRSQTRSVTTKIHADAGDSQLAGIDHLAILTVQQQY